MAIRPTNTILRKVIGPKLDFNTDVDTTAPLYSLGTNIFTFSRESY